VGILEAEKALWKLHLPRPFNPWGYVCCIGSRWHQ
jgi:hypothetical protein